MRTVIFSPDRGDRPDVNNVGVVITDGQSDNGQVQTGTKLFFRRKKLLRVFSEDFRDFVPWLTERAAHQLD